MGLFGKLFGRQETPKITSAQTARPTLASMEADRVAAEELDRQEKHAGRVGGKHFTLWIPELDRLRSLGAPEEDKYLALVLKCVAATERASVFSGREPAPAYTERAAIVYRRRKDYSAEIAIIERWEQACLPERRGPGARQAKLAERLAKARELAAK